MGDIILWIQLDVWMKTTVFTLVVLAAWTGCDRCAAFSAVMVPLSLCQLVLLLSCRLVVAQHLAGAYCCCCCQQRPGGIGVGIRGGRW